MGGCVGGLVGRLTSWNASRREAIRLGHMGGWAYGIGWMARNGGLGDGRVVATVGNNNAKLGWGGVSICWMCPRAWSQTKTKLAKPTLQRTSQVVTSI